MGIWGTLVDTVSGGPMNAGALGSTRQPSLADRLNEQYGRATGNRPAPQSDRVTIGAPTMVDTTRADQWRAQNQALAAQLANVASGREKGAGELAVGRSVGNALGQAYGAATMARGNSAAGGARAAARSAGAIGLGGAGMAKEAALGDQASARGQLASVIAQGQGADLSTAGANAGAMNTTTLAQAQMDQQRNLANVEAQLRSQGMNDQMIAQILGMMQSQDQYNRSLDAARNPSLGQILGGLTGQAGQIIGAL